MTAAFRLDPALGFLAPDDDPDFLGAGFFFPADDEPPPLLLSLLGVLLPPGADAFFAAGALRPFLISIRAAAVQVEFGKQRLETRVSLIRFKGWVTRRFQATGQLNIQLVQPPTA
jgi:hypothetical protein